MHTSLKFTDLAKLYNIFALSSLANNRYFSPSLDRAIKVVFIFLFLSLFLKFCKTN